MKNSEYCRKHHVVLRVVEVRTDIKGGGEIGKELDVYSEKTYVKIVPMCTRCNEEIDVRWFQTHYREDEDEWDDYGHSLVGKKGKWLRVPKGVKLDAMYKHEE